jgi:hypothetical protein
MSVELQSFNFASAKIAFLCDTSKFFAIFFSKKVHLAFQRPFSMGIFKKKWCKVCLIRKKTVSSHRCFTEIQYTLFDEKIFNFIPQPCLFDNICGTASLYFPPVGHQ